MAQSSVPNGFTFELLVGSGVADESSIGADHPAGAEAARDQRDSSSKVDPSAEFTDEQKFDYDIGLSYWTMDIADPDELVTFAVDPNVRGQVVLHRLQQPAGHHSGRTRPSRHSTRPKRQELYTKIQTQAAEDAFMGFLYYSPYRYAYSDKVHGFKVYPTGNYHMEDVWLKQ